MHFLSEASEMADWSCAGWEGRGGPAKPPDPTERAEPRKSSEDLALSHVEPSDLQNPRESSWAGRGAGERPWLSEQSSRWLCEGKRRERSASSFGFCRDGLLWIRPFGGIGFLTLTIREHPPAQSPHMNVWSVLLILTL